MDNLQIYNAVKEVPQTAKKPIAAGRLKGMTDISPMWRIKCLTEQFGPVGFGWYYEIAEKWLEPGAGGVISAFVRILLYVKYEGEWSKPIEGVGGSSFVAVEKNGPYTSDECYKMALTDAISVACKALGMGADVYWQGDSTKYYPYPPENLPPALRETSLNVTAQAPAQPEQPKEYKCEACGKPFAEMVNSKGRVMSAGEWYHAFAHLNTDGVARCSECMNKFGTRIPKAAGNG